MKPFGLGKKNKLCSVIAIDALFSRAEGVETNFAYPLKITWRINQARKADPDTPKFFISVPKRRFKHAVDRVKMRRRIREAYRLTRPELLGDIKLPLDMAIVCVADKIVDSKSVTAALSKLLTKIAEQCRQSSQASES
ncbi:MAG: ribonuclease P protein component [Bacteroidales bacterium]|nr:ribonuclease P protein component [Bacteroidales bacterium]